MHSEQSKNSNRRSAERVPISPEKPVYAQLVFEGIKLNIFVENLSTGGALLLCPDICESLNIGRRLADGVLVLPDTEEASVDVIVRWKLWPRVGVQFDGISPETTAQLSLFLESLKATPLP
jgi:hypothetical protein